MTPERAAALKQATYALRDLLKEEEELFGTMPVPVEAADGVLSGFLLVIDALERHPLDPEAARRLLAAGVQSATQAMLDAKFRR